MTNTMSLDVSVFEKQSWMSSHIQSPNTGDSGLLKLSSGELPSSRLMSVYSPVVVGLSFRFVAHLKLIRPNSNRSSCQAKTQDWPWLNSFLSFAHRQIPPHELVTTSLQWDTQSSIKTVRSRIKL